MEDKEFEEKMREDIPVEELKTGTTMARVRSRPGAKNSLLPARNWCRR